MMKSATKTGFASLAILCGLGWLVVACPASLDDRCADGACVSAATQSEAGATDGEAGTDAPVTDPCVGNPTALDCLNNEDVALFVRPNGNDADPAAGAKASPFKTITAALGKITPKKRRIYVCTGAYFEDLSLNATHTGVSIFGGVDCAWNPDATAKPIIGASANPLKIDGVNGLAMADVAVVAKDAAKGSSIAAFVFGSDVSFNRVRLAAGTGAKGDDGIRTDFVLPTDLNGIDGTAGGAQKLVNCPGGLQTVGGKGGASGGFDGASGSPGPDNKGTVLLCAGATPAGGGNGAVGVSPTPAAGASTLGELTAQGWQPTSGHDGMNGGPGQGGGGGAGLGGGTGGGGGAGGCGGIGGGGGAGGGASVALVSFQSSVHVTASVLQAKDAGPGGAGANGQAGATAGGAGGSKTTATTACNGGAGGAGGTGASGGGGAGGISAGILSKGSKPVLDDATSKTIVFGAKGGAGGAAGQQLGVVGAAQAVFELP